MVSDPRFENIQERVIAAAALCDALGKASNKIDAFASWLLAGFGGAMALLISSHDALAWVTADTARAELKLFGWALVVTVAQKYLAIIVTCGAEGAASGRALVREHLKEQRDQGQEETFNVKAFADEFRKAAFWPASRFVASMNAKALAGDVGAASRLFFRCMQIQAMLLVVEIVLFLFAVRETVRAIG